MRIFFEIAGGQIDGARDYQEDAFLHSYLDITDDPKSTGVVIMADGMGGHAAGNIASNLVVSTFNKTFNASFDADDIPNALRVSLAKANGALSESIRETPALDGMGCTMVAGVFHAGKVWWVSVGDSHLYLIRDRELSKKNEDHSYGGYLDRMAAQGMEIEPEPGLSRNMLMSAMTGDDIAEIDCPNEHVQLLPGDRLIIASDGLDTLSSGSIIQMSAWSQTPKNAVEALLKAVEDADKPRQDNTTVIVIDVVDRDADGAAPTDPAPKPKSDKDDTKPIEEALKDIEDLDDVAPPAQSEPVKAEATMQVAGLQDDDDDDDEGSLSIVRVLIAAVVLLAILGGAGYGVWAYLSGSDDTGDGPPVAATEPTAPVPAPAPAQPPQAPAPSSETVGLESQGSDSAAPAPAPAKSAPKPSRDFRDPLSSGGEGPTMVVISGGTFRMGVNSFDAPTEGPARNVGVPGFAASKYEVTQGEYKLFADATGRQMPEAASAGDDYPVVNVSWDDAVAYTRWLSEQTGETYRLLSEAEWEYLASAGTGQSYWWGFDFETGRAHCFDCATDYTTSRPAKVGKFEANGFGIHDTAGNVLEWVQDCYHANYSGAPTDGSVWREGGDCSKRMARGGAYNSPGDSLRAQKRAAYQPSRGRRNIGIRIAREM